MRTSRLGCLSPTALLAAILTAAVISGYAVAHGSGMFNPGPLSTLQGPSLGGVASHAEIGDNCSACHASLFGPARMDDLCLGCHQAVAAELLDVTKLHGKLQARSAVASCRNCHPEHRGPDAPLTFLDARHFPHSALGFALKTHQRRRGGDVFTCEDCHEHNSFLGFRQETCANCHSEMDSAFLMDHRLAFGANCTGCHDGIETYGSHFNHNRVSFKLVDKHAGIDCSKCHAGAANILDLKATPQACASCHTSDDPHAGRLGAACDECHSVKGWKPAKFDHDQAQFKLMGRHTKVDCAECHQNRILQGTPALCSACHQKDDPHAGQFDLECSACHTADAWDQVKVEHNLFSFQLLDRHAEVACAECHLNGVFAGTPASCVGCHKKDDKHSGQFVQDCDSCHAPTTWKEVRVDHNAFAFKLTGSHIGIGCNKCHSNGVYVAAPQTCSACHSKDDAHRGQLGPECARCHNATAWKPSTFNHNSAAFVLTGAHIAVNCTACHSNGVFSATPRSCSVCHARDDAHSGHLGSECAKCHNTSAWKPSTFNHNNAVFALTGAHASAACTSCHVNGTFRGTPQNCGACHANDDAHHGQYGSNCAQCHTTNAWKPSTFNHNNAAFKLTGAHVGAACTACHTNGVFKGTPTSCGACHAGDDNHNGRFGTNCGSCHSTSAWKPATFDHNLSSFPLTGAHSSLACSQCHGGSIGTLPTACSSCHSEPAYHAGMFGGQSCSACHNTSAWRPAQYGGPHSFPMNHGNANTCSDCHQPNLTTWSCTLCHSQAKMDEHHHEVSGYDSNCLRCHPSGRGD